MKKTTTEITEKFDTNGKIVERVTKTTTEDTAYSLPYYPSCPCYPDWTYRPFITGTTIVGTGSSATEYGESTTTTTTSATYDTARTATNGAR